MHDLVAARSSQKDSRLVAKAALRAAGHLGMTHGELAEVIGVSPSVISKIHTSDAALPKSPKAREMALLFIRLYRALDAIVGGEDRIAAKWLRNANLALNDRPIVRIKTAAGLIDTLSYLDARRALV